MYQVRREKKQKGREGEGEGNEELLLGEEERERRKKEGKRGRKGRERAREKGVVSQARVGPCDLGQSRGKLRGAGMSWMEHWDSESRRTSPRSRGDNEL